MKKKELVAILQQHKEWLADNTKGNRADLRGADLQDADLREADLSKADLYGADLRESDLQVADLYGADLRRADLERADLRRADLRRADLRGADLQGADLYQADLNGAVLYMADLSGANLRGADLYGAVGIYSFGPIGVDKRIGYAIKHADCVMVRLGCFWGTSDEAIEAVQKKYGENSTYEKQIRLAVEILESEG